MKPIMKYAVKQSFPITCSYLFVSFAYGIMMQEAGLGAGWSLLTSLTVYTGAFQFVLVTLLSGGASYLTIAVTALFSRISWMMGACFGGILGQLIPFELKGIDFCMTALFVVIFLDQWKAFQDHLPAILGIGIGTLLLLCLGQDVFMLPTLVLVSGILILLRRRFEENE